MEYRTTEQFTQIMENAENGNWTDAAKMAVRYGFYANDLISAYKEQNFDFHIEPTDLAIIVEMASEQRLAS